MAIYLYDHMQPINFTNKHMFLVFIAYCFGFRPVAYC